MPLSKIIPIPEPPAAEQKLENRRLWIGNLDSCVSEYQLLKILEKHGRMEKFDLLFHRSGPLAGQPRGYAFVTYSTNEESQKMKDIMDGKKIGTKNIVVRWAHDMGEKEREKNKVEIAIPALAGAKGEQQISRTTKIQAIEAKLKMMETSSNCEFHLNDGTSAINVSQLQRNGGKGKVKKPFSKTKMFSRPYQRR